ncbi:uncharacterized protein LOC130803854 [Amaranthus tricolor]|uniref:uncharacterized protein LOC130803854 n=1 Tax=Amaranthus tricolor TaxID=29722 RepID=UPI00258832D0|nr:uncharacterized protein LOC130803854 [Amaranthus tricolor]XP_057524045.1 uncharacterized protein LOC130803854 [Amaranthus tricolor]XP_057524046.1 uncharacterized protein LOC130803854 [Amaranthus tricolor]
MDEYPGRRSSSGLAISRRGSSLVLRDSPENNRDRNVHVCSRVGCSSKMNSMKDSPVSSPIKAKNSKTPFRSATQRKEITGSSSKTVASPNNARKALLNPKKKSPSHCDTDSETSTLVDETEEQGKTRMKVHPEPEFRDYSVEAMSVAGCSNSGPTTRFGKRSTQRFALGQQDSGPTNQGPRNGSAGTSRCNLRSLKCNSISDIIPSGSSVSSPVSNLSRKRDTSGQKKIREADGSLSVKGKKVNGTIQDGRRIDYTNRGVSISDSRRARSSNPGARRLSARTLVSNQESENSFPLVESPIMNSSSPQPDIATDETDSGFENQFSGQILNSQSSFSRPGSGTERVRSNRSIGPYDVGFARSFMNRDSLRHYNLDGIAEMLLALERIEQEEEPTYEQLLVLETNVFLGGLGFNDQHRDMRLDIDDMSYEELLALEERMGTVSTAVPEEVLTKCLKRSIYHCIADCIENGDEVKCSICQEEYEDGQEVGRLVCEHKYHTECINQWLRLKNWCPICKASVAPSPSESLAP